MASFFVGKIKNVPALNIEKLIPAVNIHNCSINPFLCHGVDIFKDEQALVHIA